MDIRQIKILLDKYDKAETSLEEERLLRNYFSGQVKIPEDLVSYSYLFRYFNSEQDIRNQNPGLEKKLGDMIDSRQKSVPGMLLRPNIIRWAAAAVFIAAVSTIALVELKSRKPDMGTYNDPQLAYREAQRTLMYISQTLNYGTKELNNISKINSSVENLKNLEKLNMGFDKLKMISKLDETSKNNKE
jgi:hypothetical protein